MYREMLSQAWKRGAALPNDHEAIQALCNVRPDEWARCWPLISEFWRVEGDSLVNATQLEVYADALSRAERASERGRRGAAARHGAPAVVKPEKPRQKPAGKSWKFSSLYVSDSMHAIILRALGPRAAAVNFDQMYEAAALEYLEKGEPADRLNDLKRRAIAAANVSREVGPPSVEESAARRAREAAEFKPLTDEERARVKASLRGVLSAR